jgi:very-short-patch-repair endonuclease
MREFVLRKKQTGYKFSRQKPLWSFIADFYCSELLLVIELDWNSHNDKYVEDKQRTDTINDLWIIVIRYTNADMLNNIEWIKSDLKQKIKSRENHMVENHK